MTDPLFDTTVAKLTLAQLAAAYEDFVAKGKAVGINNRPTKDAEECRFVAMRLRQELLKRPGEVTP